ncbi:hypothetical protein U1Q18_010804 [Sarracenia purpurea var. burkii]
MNSAFDGLSMNEEEEGNINRRMGRRRQMMIDGQDEAGADQAAVYKSKNLEAERRRRQKLSDRLHQLRSSVPNITNMNKATIITDAIAYIEELQNSVKDLRNQLFEMEADSIEERKATIDHAIEATENMNKWGKEPEVKVSRIDTNKLWIKIVKEKKRGWFTELMEAMNVLGCEITDASVTTSKGAILITACLVGNCARVVEAEEIRELLLRDC